MISYALNFEDVILQRAFADVEKGFYIDVGVKDPNQDSVTRFFYETGWSGINIALNERGYEQFLRHRRRDFNLPPTRQHHSSSENPGVNLAQMLSGLVMAETIHMLRIGFECYEAHLIEETELTRLRPWIILIGISDYGPEGADHKRKCSLQNIGYVEAYSDGLNIFYLAEEKIELQSVLGLPPNVFDQFELSGTATNTFTRMQQAQIQGLKEHNSRLSIELAEVEGKVLEQKNELIAISIQLARAQEHINAINASRSWQLTRPVRWSGFQLRLLREHGLLGRLGALVRRVFLHRVSKDQGTEITTDYNDARLTTRAKTLSGALRSMIRQVELL